LLQGLLINPHATLIALFMNAVDENTTEKDRIVDMGLHSPTMKRPLKYLPLNGRPTNPSDPEVIKFSYARAYVATYDHIFNR
jgi:hypothetical protein